MKTLALNTREFFTYNLQVKALNLLGKLAPYSLWIALVIVFALVFLAGWYSIGSELSWKYAKM